MANTGNTFVVTGENNAGIGATAWTSPGNIVSDNTTDATCAAAASSQYLVGRNLGFTIPATAKISGVLVRVEASEHSAGTEALLAQLQNDSAALFGSSKSASNEGNISGTTKAIYTYGSTTDLWGATITPTIVNNANFGVRFWFTTAHDVRIDFVTIAIEYGIGVIPYSRRRYQNKMIRVMSWLSPLLTPILLPMKVVSDLSPPSVIRKLQWDAVTK